jgi:hypothetical protein
VKDVQNKDDEDVEENVDNTATILPSTPTQVAKERFETLEKTIAMDILRVLLAKEAQEVMEVEGKKKTNSARKILIRSLQITSVGLVVGGLFAVTGGLAAPALASAISALGVGAAIPVFATLTTHAALASLFGVVGGGLAAYKMKRRTAGLSEWRIRKETTSTTENTQIHGLHATVCVSGWLQSKQDFQTPFGVPANDPPCQDKLELLQRFFAVHAPDKIQFCKVLLKANKNNETDLWARLEAKFGCDPDHLVPFEKKPELLFDAETEESIQNLLTAHVFDEVHAKEMEEIFEANHMLQQMEMMNAEMFAQMNTETLEAMQEYENTNTRAPVNDGDPPVNRDANSDDAANTIVPENAALDHSASKEDEADQGHDNAEALQDAAVSQNVDKALIRKGDETTEVPCRGDSTDGLPSFETAQVATDNVHQETVNPFATKDQREEQGSANSGNDDGSSQTLNTVPNDTSSHDVKSAATPSDQDMLPTPVHASDSTRSDTKRISDYVVAHQPPRIPISNRRPMLVLYASRAKAVSTILVMMTAEMQVRSQVRKPKKIRWLFGIGRLVTVGKMYTP